MSKFKINVLFLLVGLSTVSIYPMLPEKNRTEAICNIGEYSDGDILGDFDFNDAITFDYNGGSSSPSEDTEDDQSDEDSSENFTKTEMITKAHEEYLLELRGIKIPDRKKIKSIERLKTRWATVILSSQEKNIADQGKPIAEKSRRRIRKQTSIYIPYYNPKLDDDDLTLAGETVEEGVFRIELENTPKNDYEGYRTPEAAVERQLERQATKNKRKKLSRQQRGQKRRIQKTSGRKVTTLRDLN